MDASQESSALISQIETELREALRAREYELLLYKETLLIVKEARTGSRQIRRRAVELSRLHSESFISEFFPSLSSALT
jgi:hypothetical protein